MYKGIFRMISSIILIGITLAIAGICTADTIVVDDMPGRWTDYDNVQDAIDASTDGDTIRIYSGTFSSDIDCTKKIDIIGNGTDITTIEGSKNDHVLSIRQVSNVTLSDVSITNSGDSHASLYLNVADGITVSNIRCTESAHGIYISFTANYSIHDNVLESNTKNGLYIRECQYGIIENNTISDNSAGGVILAKSRHMTIRYNEVLNNKNRGISLIESSGRNVIYGNNITRSNKYGVSIEDSTYNVVYHNNFENNYRTGTYQAYDGDKSNEWDNGTAGNYWDDYSGEDTNGDGVGESNYTIDGHINAMDIYPLMSIWVRPRPIATIDNLSHAIAYEGEPVSFTGHAIPRESIERYSWSSSIDGVFYRGFEESFTNSSLSPGTHLISFKALDHEGSWSYQVTTSLTIDRRPIAVIDEINPDSAYQDDPIHFSGYGVDPDGTIVGYIWSSSIDGELYNGTNGTFALDGLSVGRHSISFMVQDDIGQWSEEVFENFTVSIKPSIISITPNPSVHGERVSFTGGMGDGVTFTSYEWESDLDGVLYNGTDRSFSLDDLSNGIHEISLKVEIDNGSMSGIATIRVVVYDEPVTRDDQWHQYGRFGNNSNHAPDVNVTGLGMFTSVNLSNSGNGIPIIDGDKIYLTTGVYSNGTIWAIDRPTMTVDWRLNTTEGFDSAPQIIGDTLVVCSDYFVWGLSSNGTLLWNTTIERCIQTPKIAYGMVMITTYYELIFIDPTDGSFVFNLSIGRSIGTTAAVEGNIFVGTGGDIFAAFDPGSGKEVWNYSTDEYCDSPALVHEDMVIFGSGSSYRNGSVYALDVTNGDKVWNRSFSPGVDTAFVAVDDVLIVSSQIELYGLDIDDGSILWNFTIGFPSTPIVVDGLVAVPIPGWMGGFKFHGSFLYLIDPATGSIVHEHKFDGGIDAFLQSGPKSPSVADEFLYIQYGTYLYSFDLTHIANVTDPDPNGTEPNGTDPPRTVLLDLEDGTGDVMDEHEKKVGGWSDIDITDVGVYLYENDTVLMEVSVVGSINEDLLGTAAFTYTIFVYSDGSDNIKDPNDTDYTILYTGGMASVQDTASGGFTIIDVVVSGSTLQFFIPLSDIGDDDDFRINVVFVAILNTDVGSGSAGDVYIDWTLDATSQGGPGSDGEGDGTSDIMSLLSDPSTLIILLIIVVAVVVLVAVGSRKRSKRGERPGKTEDGRSSMTREPSPLRTHHDRYPAPYSRESGGRYPGRSPPEFDQQESYYRSGPVDHDLSDRAPRIIEFESAEEGPVDKYPRGDGRPREPSERQESRSGPLPPSVRYGHEVEWEPMPDRHSPHDREDPRRRGPPTRDRDAVGPMDRRHSREEPPEPRRREPRQRRPAQREPEYREPESRSYDYSKPVLTRVKRAKPRKAVKPKVYPCPECGEPLENADARFCAKCGTYIG